MGNQKLKKMVDGFVWNCATELKILLTALVVLFSLATLFQFIPVRFSLSATDFRHCLTTTLPDSPAAVVSHVSASPSPQSSPIPPPPPPPSVRLEETLPNGVIKRGFTGVGAAAYTFVLMSAYRGGVNTFAVMGLASKPLHVYGSPEYQCEWVPHGGSPDSEPISVAGRRILPDWGYGRVYTAVVVNCTFTRPVGGDGSGGKLLIAAFTRGGGDRNVDATDRVEALAEPPGFVNASAFDAPPRYEFLYCGSSLYGDLSPQRVREWMAYHVRLFGKSSHFVFHDAGGVHPAVMEVLWPWMELGYVTLHDIKDQERFDGYYHNQFLVVNDCLHRYKFEAKWIFFFDVDEYIFVPPKNTLMSVLKKLSDYTQFTIEQRPMASQLCLSADAGQTHRKWGMEKLVYKDVQKGIWRDRKYAVQPRNVHATGVHMSQNLANGSRTTHKTEHLINYYHYHGTIAQRREPCRIFLNTTTITRNKVPYVLDTTMRSVAGSIKVFEYKTIGTRLRKTRQ